MKNKNEALTIEVSIVSIEQDIYAGPALFVSAPALNGEVGILPRHAPLISPLRAGEVRIVKPDGKQELICLSGGMLEVQPGLVTILADTAVRAAGTDKAAAEEARRLAEKARDEVALFTERDEAHAMLLASIAEISVIREMYKRRRR
jgi:F-type H+-transporting ATPase subunit epsilon